MCGEVDFGVQFAAGDTGLRRRLRAAARAARRRPARTGSRPIARRRWRATFRPSPAWRCGAEGPLGDRHVGVGERVPVHPPVAGAVGVADGRAEDVGAVVVGRPFRVHEAAVHRVPGRRLWPTQRYRWGFPGGRGRRRGSRSTGSPRRTRTPVPEVWEKLFGERPFAAAGLGQYRFGCGRGGRHAARQAGDPGRAVGATRGSTAVARRPAMHSAHASTAISNAAACSP